MGKRAILAVVVLVLGGPAVAEHAFMPEAGSGPELVPVGTREVCTFTEWGYDEVRTDCRNEALPARPGNPALKGLCTIRYGYRACY